MRRAIFKEITDDYFDLNRSLERDYVLKREFLFPRPWTWWVMLSDWQRHFLLWFVLQTVNAELVTKDTFKRLSTLLCNSGISELITKDICKTFYSALQGEITRVWLYTLLLCKGRLQESDSTPFCFARGDYKSLTLHPSAWELIARIPAPGQSE